MKKLATALMMFLLSVSFAFAFGVAEEESVDVSGVIDSVDMDDSDVYMLEIVSEDKDETWPVVISASEFDRFELSEDAEIELTAVRTGEDRLEVSKLVVDDEEFEVDRTKLERDEDEIEVETEEED